MSTKALSKVLEFFLQRARHDEMALLDAAEAELDAIEEAAKTIDGCFFIGEPYRRSETCRDAATLMRSIANEATALNGGGTT